mgnify:CR=1 FL=1
MMEADYCRQCRRDTVVAFNKGWKCDLCENWAEELQYWNDLFRGGKIYAESQ